MLCCLLAALAAGNFALAWRLVAAARRRASQLGTRKAIAVMLACFALLAPAIAVAAYWDHAEEMTAEGAPPCIGAAAPGQPG